MRYIAKIHVLDCLEEVIVSGYVYDADDESDPDHEPTEFTLVTPGRGLDDPMTWLQVHLYQALHQETARASGGTGHGQPMGGAHTLSETGVSPNNTVR